ncbi:MAG: NAD(P)-binding protein [Kofleriaceae bacterium]
MVAKRKIAVLGGGAASLFAVWDLMKASPDAYDITIYQMGWRLGGKGASGRGDQDRIEEHGLHLMFGFYENVFRVVREAYTAYFKDPNDVVWQEFFKTDDTQVAMIHYLDPQNQTWEPWAVPYPHAAGGGLPGDPGFKNSDNGLVTILRNMWAWLKGLVKLYGTHLLMATTPNYDAISIDQMRKTIDTLTAPSVTLSAHSSNVQVWSLGEAFNKKLTDNSTVVDVQGDPRRMAGLRKLVVAALAHLALPPGLLAMATFVTTVATGLAMDVFIPRRDWFAIDTYDLRAWLLLHGYDSSLDENSPPVDGLYDAVFASYSLLGAGAVLQAALKAAFLFRGGAIWKMQTGMGEAIFVPLFRALEAKGVTFKFFHRVDRLHSADGTSITSIDIERQVNAPGYDPLVTLKVTVGGTTRDLECWPSEPKWADLPAGTPHGEFENTWTPRGSDIITLAQGQDYDRVILGISVAALPTLCAELYAADPAFATHISCLGPATTATEAMQLWWAKAPVQPEPLVVPNGDPYDTVADMSQLVTAEGRGPEVVAISYLCSALKECSPVPPRSVTEYPAQLQTVATTDGQNWVANRGPVLWRSLVDPAGGFDWNALYDPAGNQGPARFSAQYVNAPTNLSDRYVLPVPMSFQHRLVANGTVFRNLYITGDWIKTALSIGCLECAAMSGIQAAQALALECGTTAVPSARNDWLPALEARGGGPPHALVAGVPSAPYRRRDGELIAPPPYQIVCDNLYAFFLRADPTVLAQAVATDLGGVSGHSYTPLKDWVVLYAATLSNVTLGTTCRSSEIGLWVPILRDDDPATVRMYTPYVWLDSATSTIVGRSIYGYTKQTANVVIPNAPGTMSVVGDALATTTSAPLEVRRSPLITATVVPPANPKPWDPSSVLDLAHLVGLAASALAVDPAIVLGMANGMQSVFLKQLPAADGAAASYQQIVEGSLRPRLISIGGKLVPGTWTIEMPVYQQPRISDVLGLDVTTRFGAGNQRVSVISPIAQFWMRFDGQLDPGTVVP